MLRVGNICLATGRQRPILASYCCCKLTFTCQNIDVLYIQGQFVLYNKRRPFRRSSSNRLGLGSWCLTPLPAIFQSYRGGQFYWWSKPEYSKENHKPVTSHQLYYTKLCRVHLVTCGISLLNVQASSISAIFRTRISAVFELTYML